MSRKIALLLFLFTVPLGAHTWPKLQNGSFDKEIWPWAIDFPTTANVELSQEDANRSTNSRSLKLQIAENAVTQETRLFECIAIDASKLYVAGVRAKVPAGQHTETTARLTLTWYADNQCTGATVPSSFTHDVWTTSSEWQRLDLSKRMPPANATHVLYTLSVHRVPRQSRSVHALFDDAYFAAVTEEKVIPAIASLRGAVNSDWSSDLYLVNRGTAEASALLLYRCLQGSVCNLKPREVTVPAKGSLLIKDAAATLFESPSSGGAVEVWIDGDLVVTTRLNSRAPRGTFGAEVPAISPHQLATRVFPGIRNNADFRTNIGIYSSLATQARIEIYVDGALVSSRTVAIPSHTLVQLNAFEGVVVTTDNAWIRLVTSQAGVASYVSVVDNATNDVAYSTGVAEP